MYNLYFLTYYPLEAEAEAEAEAEVEVENTEEKQMKILKGVIHRGHQPCPCLYGCVFSPVCFQDQSLP